MSSRQSLRLSNYVTVARQLTNSQGLDDAMQHGKDLKSVYGDLLKFLPDGNDREKYSFRVTNNVSHRDLGVAN